MKFVFLSSSCVKLLFSACGGPIENYKISIPQSFYANSSSQHKGEFWIVQAFVYLSEKSFYCVEKFFHQKTTDFYITPHLHNS